MEQLLLDAIKSANANEVTHLIRRGANINQKHKNGSTALNLAAGKGNVQVVRQLLHFGAQINAVDNSGWTALMIAAWGGHTEVVRHLLKAGAQIDLARQDGWTALMTAGHRKHSKVVENLLMNGADVHLVNRQGDTALHVAVQEDHQEIVRQLLKAGSDLHKKNKSRKSALCLASNAHFAAELRRIHSQHRPLNDLENFWIHAKASRFTQKQLVNSLKHTHITSLPTFIIAHNLLLLAVRKQIVGGNEIRSLRGIEDYVLGQVYLPVTRLQLSKAEKYLVSQVLTHAEKVGFIRDGHAALVRTVAGLRIDIPDTQMQLRTVLVSVARELWNLDERVSVTGRLNGAATGEFEKLCKENLQIVEDMQNMSSSLNKLHSLLRKPNRNNKVTGIVGLCLSMIPLVGAVPTASDSSKLFFGISLEQASSGVFNLLSMDLSSFRTAQVLTSDDFLNKLDAVIQKRVQSVVQSCEFRTLTNVQNEISSTISEIQGFEIDMMDIDEEEAELRQRFNVLASKVDTDTVSAYAAIQEMMYVLQTKAWPEVIQLSQVTKSVVDEADETGRISVGGFLSSFSKLKELCSGPKKRSIPNELRQRFQDAAKPDKKLLVVIARTLLHKLFQESCGEGNSTGRRLSFTRTTDVWDDSEVDELFKEHLMDEIFIEEEGFTDVGMRVLFRKRRKTVCPRSVESDRK